MIVYDDDRREALVIWKSRLGSGATYRALVEVFFKAGRLDYADAVCDLLKDSSDTRGREDKYCSILKMS
jgi:pentatricopeptide repeat protein